MSILTSLALTSIFLVVYRGMTTLKSKLFPTLYIRERLDYVLRTNKLWVKSWDNDLILYESEYDSKIYRKGNFIKNHVKYKKIKIKNEESNNEQF